ncbi:MAG: PilZ domain-containing protein [Clostridium sp.]|nr:PilZ domain-containing protein [Acetatifactor muris]MCM1527837.1 PilZ domain-containing protein [Bacteroides sp.]MCM1563337.1 PilZ domain-containing protein [Clostridium sp.]
MEERRRSKRTALESHLTITRLDGDEHTEVAVEITDVSKSGLGFTADCLLEIGQVYESHLTIWTKEVLHVLLRIVRIELEGTEYVYGATFMGMSDTDAGRIAVYQTFHDEE